MSATEVHTDRVMSESDVIIAAVARDVAAAKGPQKPLLCREALRQLRLAEAELQYYRKLFRVVTLFDALFIVVSLVVIIQYVRGHQPKGAVDNIVFVTPIVAALLGSGGALYLKNQRKHEEEDVTTLTAAFNAACKDVPVKVDSVLSGATAE